MPPPQNITRREKAWQTAPKSGEGTIRQHNGASRSPVPWDPTSAEPNPTAANPQAHGTRQPDTPHHAEVTAGKPSVKGSQEMGDLRAGCRSAGPHSRDASPVSVSASASRTGGARPRAEDRCRSSGALGASG